MACLDRARHRVALLAPGAAGSALVGPGPSEVRELLRWESPGTASLFAGDVDPPLRDQLAVFDAAVAYTRSADLAKSLGAAIPRLVVHDPAPAAGSGHAAEWLARPVTSLGAACTEGPPTLRATDVEREQAAAILRELPRRFLAVHPGSGSPDKTWPAARFTTLLDALGADRFLLVEGPADTRAAAAVRARGGGVTARGLSPRVLGAALAEAGVYVGSDSGVSHLAAAWGAPTAALFGPTDPGIWSPVGPRVAVVRSHDRRMEGIAVEAVAAAVTQLLAEEGGPR